MGLGELIAKGILYSLVPEAGIADIQAQKEKEHKEYMQRVDNMSAGRAVSELVRRTGLRDETHRSLEEKTKEGNLSYLSEKIHRTDISRYDAEIAATERRLAELDRR